MVKRNKNKKQQQHISQGESHDTKNDLRHLCWWLPVVLDSTSRGKPVPEGAERVALNHKNGINIKINIKNSMSHITQRDCCKYIIWVYTFYILSLHFFYLYLYIYLWNYIHSFFWQERSPRANTRTFNFQV